MSEGFAARQQSYERLVAKVRAGGVLKPSEITAMERFEAELAELTAKGVPASLATPEEAAAYCGYSVRTIYTAVKAGKLARRSDGGFDRYELDRYLAAKGRTPVLPDDDDDAGEPDSPSSAAEDRRWRSARADREELLVQKLRGEVLALAEVERQWTARAYEYRNSLLLLSRRCGHLIAAAAGCETRLVTEIIDAEVRALLGSLCRKIEMREET